MPMNQHRARLFAFGLAASGCLGQVLALGQNQPAPARRAGASNEQPPHNDNGHRQEPNHPVTNNGAQDAALSMRRNGNSLLKATLNAKQDRAQARLADVSFGAVPEPVPRTLRKHDQVTIIVREESEFRSKGNSKFKKEAEFEARVDEFIKLQIKNAEIEGGALGPNPPSIRASGKRDFKGEGAVDRSDMFTTRVQAEIIDVKPNGTLVLQARSHIRNDDEDRYFVLTGN